MYMMRGSLRSTMRRTLAISLFFFLIFAKEAHAEVALSCVFLIEMNAFTAQGLSARFETILASAFSTTGVALQSIQSASLSGAEVRQLYFPKRTDISLFSVVHLTRVVASIPADAGVAKTIAPTLPPLCADLAPMAVERVGPPSQSWFDDFIQLFPPSLGFVMVILWVVTAASCGVCWLCWLCQCCGGRKPEKKKDSPKEGGAHENSKKEPEHHQEAHKESGNPPHKEINPPHKEGAAPSAPPPPHFAHAAFPPPTPRRRFVEQPPSGMPTQFSMRLPSGLQCADRADPCAAPPSHAGPAAVRLGW